MNKELYVSSTPHENRVAVTENGEVAEIYIEREKEYSLAGSIYKGRVTRVLPGMQSAFVDIGLDRDAFLYVSDFFEDSEEYDRVVSEAESAVARHEAHGPAAGPTVAATEPGRPRGERAEAARPAGETGEGPRESPREARAPGVGEGPDDGRRGRRGRHRGRRGGAGFPDEKFAREGEGGGEPRHEMEAPDAAAATLAPIEPGVPESEVTPFLLPGESLAKYHTAGRPENPRRSRPEPAERETGAEYAEQPPAVAPKAAPESDLPPAATLAPEAALVLPGESLAKYRGRAGSAAVVPPAEPKFLRRSRRSSGESDAAAEAADEGAGEGAVEETESISREDFEHERSQPDSPLEAVYADKGEERGGEAAADNTDADEAEATAYAAGHDARGEERDGGYEYATEAGEAGHVADRDAVGVEDGRRPAGGGREGESEEGRRSRRRRGRGRRGERRDERESGSEIGHEAAAGGERPVRDDARPPRDDARPARERRPEREGGKNESSRLISDLLHAGQEILVQISKEPLGKKGARITSHLALPGRFLVYMPTVHHIGVSRKISSDQERARLKRLLLEATKELPGGFIVRTAGAGASDEEILADIRLLANQWNDMRAQFEQMRAPALLHHDLDLIERTLRDQLSDEFSHVWVDTDDQYQRVVKFVSYFMPHLTDRVRLYTRDEPMFEHFGIQEEINKSLKSKVWLKSGGYIVLNQTEALVAIDINTGKYVGRSNRLEDTIVKTNVEAIQEIVRQIRLRDLGGIIVIDFIDMDERKNRQRVMQALEEAMRADRAPSKILSFNDFGLVALTRKRVKQSLERTLGSPCPYCDGVGLVKSPLTVCNEIYSEVKKQAPNIERDDLVLRVNPEVAKVLKAQGAQRLREMEDATRKALSVRPDPQVHQEQFEIY